MFGILLIMIILLAVLALVVVKALADSPWGSFTVFATIPIALFMGVYTVHPAGRIGEMSVIGFVLLMLAIVVRPERQPRARCWAPMFTFSGETLA